jgi:DDE domain
MTRGRDQAFEGRQFTAEVILWAVRWYLMFLTSYRDLELMLLDRRLEVDHTTTFRWIQAYAAELEKRIRPRLRMSNGSWRVDETYVKVKGRWIYLYWAVGSRGQTIDFLLSAKRNAEAAKRLFRKALAQPHTVNPHHHHGQERGLPESDCGDEEGWRVLAPATAATVGISKQYRRARPSERETADSTWPGLR